MKILDRCSYKKPKNLRNLITQLTNINHKDISLILANDILSPAYFDTIDEFERVSSTDPYDDITIELAFVAPVTWVDRQISFLSQKGFKVTGKSSILRYPLQCRINTLENYVLNSATGKKILEIDIKYDKLTQYQSVLLNMFNNS